MDAEQRKQAPPQVYGPFEFGFQSPGEKDPVHGRSCVETGPHIYQASPRMSGILGIRECCLGIWGFYWSDPRGSIELIFHHDPHEAFSIETRKFGMKPANLITLQDLQERYGLAGPRWESDGLCKNEGPHYKSIKREELRCEWTGNFKEVETLLPCCKRFWQLSEQREWVRRPDDQRDTFNGYFARFL